MRYPASEKLEIIRLVEASELPRRTLFQDDLYSTICSTARVRTLSGSLS